MSAIPLGAYGKAKANQIRGIACGDPWGGRALRIPPVAGFSEGASLQGRFVVGDRSKAKANPGGCLRRALRGGSQKSQNKSGGLPSASPFGGTLQLKITPLLLSVVRSFCLMPFLARASSARLVIKQKSHSFLWE